MSLYLIRDLRRAIAALQADPDGNSRDAIRQRRANAEQAHEAYLSAFDLFERARVVEAAQARDPAIKTFEQAAHSYGTRFVRDVLGEPNP